MFDYIIISANAAGILAQQKNVKSVPPFLNHNVDQLVHHNSNNTCPAILTTTEDREGYRFAAISLNELQRLPEQSAPYVFGRIERALRASIKMPVRVPISWQEYHYRSLFSFFAAPIEYGNFRWVSHINNDDNTVFFLKLTDSKSKKLEEFEIPNLPSFRSYFDECVAKTHSFEDKKTSLPFVEEFDFSTIGSSAISKSWNWEKWNSNLNDVQKQVRDLPIDESIRIVGPAGSGKTLTLCFKALQGVRKDKENNKTNQILFVTHSWAMAERIDETLCILNNGEPIQEITVMPLLEMFRDVLGKSQISNVRILGDDSTEGRKLQLNLIESLILNFPKGDIELLKVQSLSSHIITALESVEQSPERAELVEFVYEEINGVLLSEGIMPGDKTKEESYLSKERADDLPPFLTRGDRSFVLLIYKAFLLRLADREYITTDQLVSDATKLLETFSWRIKRETSGYDRIFIDELQYFDAQERFATVLLASNPETVVLVTAEDPSQGVFTSILPNRRDGISARQEKHAITMTDAHRFSPGILNFVKHLYMSFPLNAQSIMIENGQVDASGSVPSLYHANSLEDSLDCVGKLAREQYNSLGRDERLAIICLDSSSKKIVEYLDNNNFPSVVHIDSLDAADRLSYTKRSIVVGEWRFLGGTQFSKVIVLNSSVSLSQSTFTRIRDLTAIYVASSRASNSLTLILSGGTPKEIRVAVEQKLLESSNI